MSPRVIPSAATIAPPRGPTGDPADITAIEIGAEAERAEARRRQDLALESPVLRGRDQGEDPTAQNRDDSLAEVRRRLATVGWEQRPSVRGLPLFPEARDLSQSNIDSGVRPSMPGYLASVFGRASRQAGTLAGVLDQRPITAGQVSTTSGAPTIDLPRFTAGATTAIQTAQNAVVSETDPTTATISTPVGTIAGQVDVSRQLFDFSNPGVDEILAFDLGADFGTRLDQQLIAGSGVSGQIKGFAAVAGLSVVGSTTTAATFVESVWKAFSALAGTSGTGAPDPDGYLVILHPRRLGWLRGNVTGIQGQALLPGQVVSSGGVATNSGAGTNEDSAYVIEKASVILAGGTPNITIHEEIGSGTLTVRVRCSGYAALLVLNPAAVAKVTGLVAPTGF